MKIKYSKLSSFLFLPLFLLPWFKTSIPVPVVTIPATPTPTSTFAPLKIKPVVVGKFVFPAGKRGWIEKATVTQVSASSITITKEGVTYTVNTDENTLYRRRFGAQSSIGEIAVNNVVNVLGTWQNDEKTQIMAKHIRNISIQQRYAVFFGTVKSKTDSKIVLSTVNRGEQTVYLIDSTKLVNRVMEEITTEDIEVGHKIRVKGTWDSSNKTIAETTQIKDFSIPVVPSP